MKTKAGLYSHQADKREIRTEAENLRWSMLAGDAFRETRMSERYSSKFVTPGISGKKAEPSRNHHTPITADFF
jgi:hypothetical protein